MLGGDGSLLRAAELARPAGTPLIGVNLGHVGFLAEAEPDGLTETVDRLIAGDYRVEERMTLEAVVSDNGTEFARGWALNEVSVEKAARERVIEVILEVDGRPLSRWGCDGVVCATPTGSTAYAFSAGGPMVWPEVEALLMVPLAAHALFARPIVVSPRSVIAVELVDGRGEAGGHESDHAVIWCDGRRKLRLPPGARVEVRRGTLPVLLARVHGDPRGSSPAAWWPSSACRSRAGAAAAVNIWLTSAATIRPPWTVSVPLKSCTAPVQSSVAARSKLT